MVGRARNVARYSVAAFGSLKMSAALLIAPSICACTVSSADAGALEHDEVVDDHRRAGQRERQEARQRDQPEHLETDRKITQAQHAGPPTSDARPLTSTARLSTFELIFSPDCSAASASISKRTRLSRITKLMTPDGCDGLRRLGHGQRACGFQAVGDRSQPFALGGADEHDLRGRDRIGALQRAARAPAGR